MAIFDSKNIFEKQINEVFGKKKSTEMDLILKILSIIIYQNATNTDIIELYKMLDLETFVKIITLFDGRPVRLPSSDVMKENLILSLIYYYKEIKKENWEQIKKHFPFEISGISYGLRLKQINNFIRQKINELCKNNEEVENNE
jgi:hypothetical protein